MDLLAEKARKIAARRQAAKKLSSDVDAELRGSEGCFPCALFRRKKEAATAADVEAAGAAASAAEGRVKAGAASALFGLAKKQATPVEKLAEAAEAVAQRAVALETKVGEGRAEARALKMGGQKKAALRQMRRVKMIEGQLASVQARPTRRQQQLVLEQAALQKEMTTALSSSAKGLKKSKKLLSQAETAVEDASEARDAADDLSNVLAEFTTTSMLSADDDELLAELEEMASGGGGGGNSGDGDAEDEAEDEAVRAARDGEEIERRDRAWREAEATRARMPKVPSSRAVKGRAVEKQVLLAANKLRDSLDTLLAAEVVVVLCHLLLKGLFQRGALP